MDASYKIQRGIHVHLIQFFMCPEFWVHIISPLRFFFQRKALMMLCYLLMSEPPFHVMKPPVQPVSRSALTSAAISAAP